MPVIHEYRVVLNMECDEYKVAQLYSVAEASKENTGGGEGIEVVTNTPFDTESSDMDDEFLPKEDLCAGGKKFTKGQYTHKIYHLQSKVPSFIRALAPKGSLEIVERAWNAYPYCRTIVTNPTYMKDAFYIKIETMHYPDNGKMENIHNLKGDELSKRKVTTIDIAKDVSPKDYKEEFDPSKYKSEKTGRGPLKEGWMSSTQPIMCAYKLVSIKFKWFGLQGRVESFIDKKCSLGYPLPRLFKDFRSVKNLTSSGRSLFSLLDHLSQRLKQEERIFTTFHRQVQCWTDKWYGLTMEDIRNHEDQTQKDLDEQRCKGQIKGMKASED